MPNAYFIKSPLCCTYMWTWVCSRSIYIFPGTCTVPLNGHPVVMATNFHSGRGPPFNILPSSSTAII